MPPPPKFTAPNSRKRSAIDRRRTYVQRSRAGSGRSARIFVCISHSTGLKKTVTRSIVQWRARVDRNGSRPALVRSLRFPRRQLLRADEPRATVRDSLQSYTTGIPRETAFQPSSERRVRDRNAVLRTGTPRESTDAGGDACAGGAGRRISPRRSGQTITAACREKTWEQRRR